MRIKNKEITVGQIASILTILTLLSGAGFFIHGYFAKTAELVTLKTELTTYKVEQQKTVLQLKQNAQLEVWTTEQTFIVILPSRVHDKCMRALELFFRHSRYLCIGLGRNFIGINGFE